MASLSGLNAAGVMTGLATADSFFNKNSNRWLLTDEDGNPVISFTSFISAEIRCEGQAVSAPVEEGSFASYNKVNTPSEFAVSLGIQGDDAALQAALDTLTTLQAGTQLVNLVTPNAEYTSLNLEGFNYRRRREDGLGVLFVDLSLIEIKQVEARYTNVKLAPRKQRGRVQAEEKSMLKILFGG